MRCEGSFSGREGRVGEVDSKHRDDGLGLRVAEAAVVLDESWPGSGDHQPCVEHPDVRGAGGAQVIEDGGDERRDEVIDVDIDRSGSVGPHTAGVRAAIAFADSLVILGEGEGDGGGPVAECEERALRSAHPLLKEEGSAGSEGGDRLDRRGVIGGNHHTFAGRETVLFHHDRRSE